MGHRKDLTGQKFTRWTVLFPLSTKNKRGYFYWYCRCDCGTEREVHTYNLATKSSMSCGCLTKDKAKLGLSRLGKKGQKHTEETKRTIAEASHNQIWTQERKDKIGASKRGKKRPDWSGPRNNKWKGGITPIKKTLRGSSEWKNWRLSVFTRDKYTCQECGLVGGKIEPHHIIPMRTSWDSLFDTNNGITLCRPCHIKTMGREENFISRYNAMNLTKV